MNPEADNDAKGRIFQESAVVFERTLPGPIERVWALLTERESLARWLMPGSIEPRAGGTVGLGDGHIRGHVTQWKPPHLLICTWNVYGPQDVESPYPESYLRIELKAEGDAVRLTLKHGPVLADFEQLTQSGWHTMLESLLALAQGGEPEPREAVMERNRVRYGVDIERLKRARGG